MLIKYMYSLRCKMAVRSELMKLGIQFQSINLGEIMMQHTISDVLFNKLENALDEMGFEIIAEKKSNQIRQIKEIIIEMVHYAKDFPKTKTSDYISEKMNMSYASLSKTFKEFTGVTIEAYIISHKIERVKELMIYDESSLSEIAFEMNYSSEAHLSNQFKKVTGMTPSDFKNVLCNRSFSTPHALMHT
jgi:AraC-like DNA-binding protein